ncbi:MAG: type II toxin-antitoxin system RelE/ParE family toxin [Proteobacteria bacterium]|nr:type II toxin-antitoxin system RelE/ParE family toxin [Pseudomonadota bacterium]
MIINFRDEDSRKVFERRHSRRLPGTIQRAAHRKLLQLHAATRIETLRVPPANRLERLKGNRSGQYSIRINRQWRVCFEWRDGNAHNVEITDYH